MGHKWLDDEGRDWSLAAAHLNLKINGSGKRKINSCSMSRKSFFIQTTDIGLHKLPAAP
jgi:hypothetical protein